MTHYRAPVDEMRFVLNEVAGLARLEDDLALETANDEVTKTVLDEAGKFADAKWAPINKTGDQTGAVLENGVVRTAPGFKEAYQEFAEAGWNGAVFEADHGGQDLPWATQMALTEIWNAANMALAVCPLLTQAGIDALVHWGTDAQKATYLEKLVSGEWTAAMCLTEPHAGTDVGALRTKAVPEGDHYRISGTKIFITYGEHDMADNIIHLVLARLPGAPNGTKGITLFIVPKFIPDDDGAPGERNDMRCVSIEHKLGMKASPTCVMSYGDHDGAIGYLIGKEHGGMQAMFTMMNNARIAVGIQGLGIAERAYQAARTYAHERVQGRVGGQPVTIAAYPDMQRRLMAMKTQIAGMRALCYWAGTYLDRELRETEPQAKALAQERAALLTPIVKAWCTDLSIEITSDAVQCHGGMGFVEETGVAQHYRDARILPIYEGTNAVQATDLIGRKLAMRDGALVAELIAELRAEVTVGDPPELAHALDALEAATATLRARIDDEGVLGAQAAAAPYLTLFGYVTATLLLARGARTGRADWVQMLRFQISNLLPPALALQSAITERASWQEVA